MTRPAVRHLPNLLSGLRLAAAPLAAWLILAGHDTAAFVVFAAAGTSDALDGMIARRWGAVSRFGAWLDPAADKLLMLLCFTALYNVNVTPAWLLAVVVARDAAIAAAWLLIRWMALPVEVRPLRAGKLSTLAQVVYVVLALFLLAFDIAAPRLLEMAGAAAGVLTIASALAYGWMFLRGVTGRAAS